MSGFRVNQGSIRRVQRNMTTLKGTIKGRARAGMELEAGMVSNRAKRIRPWTDRTGNARRSIYGQAFETGNTIGLHTGIGVDYGVWLEVANGGRYAVVWNSVTQERENFINVLRGIL